MHVSEKAFDLIRKFEGLEKKIYEPSGAYSGRLRAYLNPFKRWAIGYGQTGRMPDGRVIEKGLEISEQEATDALYYTVHNEIEPMVRTQFNARDQNEFDALVSWAYSADRSALERGRYPLQRLINERADEASIILEWAGDINPALPDPIPSGYYRRRLAELCVRAGRPWRPALTAFAKTDPTSGKILDRTDPFFVLGLAAKHPAAGKVGKAGLDLIERSEGFKPKAYKCPAGVWTIGIGSTKWADGRDVSEGDTISYDEARDLLADYCTKEIEPAIERLIPRTLGQNEYDALASFIYNFGAAKTAKYSLTQIIADGPALIGEAAYRAKLRGAWPQYAKAAGSTLLGLYRRRVAELLLFLGHDPSGAWKINSVQMAGAFNLAEFISSQAPLAIERAAEAIKIPDLAPAKSVIDKAADALRIPDMGAIFKKPALAAEPASLALPVSAPMIPTPVPVPADLKEPPAMTTQPDTAITIVPPKPKNLLQSTTVLSGTVLTILTMPDVMAYIVALQEKFPAGSLAGTAVSVFLMMVNINGRAKAGRLDGRPIG